VRDVVHHAAPMMLLVLVVALVIVTPHLNDRAHSIGDA
jgi:hypothetical protein